MNTLQKSIVWNKSSKSIVWETSQQITCLGNKSTNQMFGKQVNKSNVWETSQQITCLGTIQLNQLFETTQLHQLCGNKSII